MEIVLSGKGWSKYETEQLSIELLGTIAPLGGNYLDVMKLAHLLESMLEPSDSFCKKLCDELLARADGSFAMVIRARDRYFFVCDTTRSFPLFMIRNADKIIVTDNLSRVDFNRIDDPVSQEEFLLTGYVTGNNTVFENVKGVQAGEVAVFENDRFTFHRYFILKPEIRTGHNWSDKAGLYGKMDSLFTESFRRMVESTPDINNWVVPLSGGYDSRMVINYLLKLGCKNVICFTYGIAYSEEVRLSEMAAKAAGYKWFWVRYEENDWKKIHEEKLFDQYITYSFNGCSLPHPLDFIAIYKLKSSGIVTGKDVIVPGLSGITESASDKIRSISSVKESLRYVFDKYYLLFTRNRHFGRFEHRLQKYYEETGQNIHSFPEYFYWHERLAKYISNWVRAYEFFGLRWRMPLRVRSLVEFWVSLKYDDRIDRSVFQSACEEYLIHDQLKGVPFLNKFDNTKQVKSNRTRFIPARITSLLVRIMNRKITVPTGHYLVFDPKVVSIKKIVGPVQIYPRRLRNYFSYILPRRIYQVNVLKIIAIYTLRNEVLRKNRSKTE